MDRKTRKKILYVITKSNFGGAQRYVFDLATSLPKDEFDVVVAFGKHGALGDKLSTAGIRTITIDSLQRDMNPLLDLMTLKSLVSLFREEGPDVVHLNSTKIGGLGALAGRIAGVKHIIYTAHGWAFNEKRSPLSVALIRLLSWVTVLLCHTIIVIAKREQEQGLAMPFSKNKIVLIRNGIGQINFKSKQDARAFLAEKIARPVDPQNAWIGTISELHANKGLTFIINALKNVAGEYIFVVIGEGEERARLEKQIQENGLGRKIFLVGHIDNASTYLKAFDIFTLTSQKEGLPYVVLEAGVTGLPVIASRVGGIPEIITDGVSGILTKAGDEHAITQALTDTLANNDRAAYGALLEKKVSTEFSLNRMVTETKNLYTRK